MGGLAAIAIPAGISLASDVLQGFIGGGGAKAAGKTVASAGQAATGAVNNAVVGGQNAVNSGITSADATLQDVINQEKNNLNPYLNLGTSTTNTLAGLTSTPGQGLLSQFSFDPSQIANTPEYQFQLQQGTEAVQNSAAARGGLFSGNTLKSLDQYSQGLASTAYQQAYNNALTTFQTNRNNTLGALLAGTGVGQTATGQFNAANQNFGNLVSQNSVQGQEFISNLGLQGAEAAGNFTMQGAQGYAAGQAGNANAFGQAVAGATGPLTTLAGLIPGVGPSLGPGGDLGNLPTAPVPAYPSGTPAPTVVPSGTTYSGVPLFPSLATNLPPAQMQTYTSTLAALRGLS